MLRRLRSLYSGVWARRIDDQAHLTYYGAPPRGASGRLIRQELNTAQVRLPRA